MSASQVLANYASLRTLTGSMREAAVQADWERLIAVEQERHRLLEATKPLDAVTVLDDGTRASKDEFIRQILADDAEIRTLVETWMQEFRTEMQRSQTELRLLKEYGAAG